MISVLLVTYITGHVIRTFHVLYIMNSSKSVRF